jgi:hypothetical protein
MKVKVSQEFFLSVVDTRGLRWHLLLGFECGVRLGPPLDILINRMEVEAQC